MFSSNYFGKDGRMVTFHWTFCCHKYINSKFNCVENIFEHPAWLFYVFQFEQICNLLLLKDLLRINQYFIKNRCLISLSMITAVRITEIFRNCICPSLVMRITMAFVLPCAWTDFTPVDVVAQINTSFVRQFFTNIFSS